MTDSLVVRVETGEQTEANGHIENLRAEILHPLLFPSSLLSLDPHAHIPDHPAHQTQLDQA